jgi:hypothetical protein
MESFMNEKVSSMALSGPQRGGSGLDEGAGNSIHKNNLFLIKTFYCSSVLLCFPPTTPFPALLEIQSGHCFTSFTAFQGETLLKGIVLHKKKLKRNRDRDNDEKTY